MKTSKILLATAVTLLTFVAGFTVVHADPGGQCENGEEGERGKRGKRRGHKACKADVERLCGDVERGKGNIKACLEEHQAELSEACQEGLAKRSERKEKKRAMRAKIEEACSADAQSFCADKEGRERRQCMKQNFEQLSDTCQAAITEARSHRKGRRGRKGGKDAQNQ